MPIKRSDHLWASDVCDLPMATGFMYLVAIMDWYSRRVLSWQLSNSLDAAFCIEAQEEPQQRYGSPQIFNSDQWSRFMCEASRDVLKDHNVEIPNCQWMCCGSERHCDTAQQTQDLRFGF
jgi:putative transposase